MPILFTTRRADTPRVAVSLRLPYREGDPLLSEVERERMFPARIQLSIPDLSDHIDLALKRE